MKKKLLITMGDSVTEGVGCYDYSKISDTSNLSLEEERYQTQRFHTYGWPNRLGKKLNYDKVINIGWAGSGQSAHVKLLFEKIIGKDFSEYDVLIVWLLSEPSRFSFYSYGRISQFLPNMAGKYGHELEVAYIKDIGNIEQDSNLETIFYIKCMEQICENNNFNLQITSWHNHSFNYIKQLYNSKYYMKSTNNNPICSIMKGEYKSKICEHPNEKGYEIISQNMFNSIQKYNPNLINQNKVDKFEWIWDGYPNQWNNII
jgi:hypothetical protein